MAIEIKEYVGAGNITVVNEQAMTPKKKTNKKQMTNCKTAKKGAKK